MGCADWKAAARSGVSDGRVAAPAPRMRKSSRLCSCMVAPWGCVGREFSARIAGGRGQFAGGSESGYGIAGGYEFHGDEALIVELAELAEDAFVVDLAGARLMAAGNIGDVDETDPI